MVMVVRNDDLNRSVVVRTGWDRDIDDHEKQNFYANYAQKFEDAFMEECEKYRIDPDICECNFDDLGSGIGDPVERAKKLVHRTLKRLKITS